jgi:hypothetical protein
MSADTISAAQWEKFFNRLGKAYSVSNALSYAKIDRSTAYRYKKNSKHIAARWEQAIADGAEYLEDTARKRAVEGVRKETGVYYQGDLIATEIEIKYSDGLLRAMLAARNPAYRLDSASQVQQQVMQELAKMVDLLQRKLPPDVYAQIIDVLALGDDGIIDVSAEDSARAQITATESTE